MKSLPLIGSGRLPAALTILVSGAAIGMTEVTRYAGMCDASAAVPAGPHSFVVANDKDSILRVYNREHPSLPIYEKDFAVFLQVADPEIDLEGATRIGDRIYWITSHGAKSGGDARSRRLLFATDVDVRGEAVTLTAVGMPYRTLIEDLAGRDELSSYALDRAATKPPESPEGLNIEGLSRTPEGGLMIGFRNPRPGGNALLVPLENPGEVLGGKAARFGSPALLDLGGRGVRSIEYADARGTYLIVGGPHDDAGSFAFFEWTGRPHDPPRAVAATAIHGLNPEALVVYPEQTSHEQVLSDDRGDEVEGVRCLRRIVAQQSFRSVWLDH